MCVLCRSPSFLEDSGSPFDVGCGGDDRGGIEGGTPPSFVRWPEDLSQLLDDAEGVLLFRKFEEDELESSALEFWLACRGLKKKARETAEDSTAADRLPSLTKLIGRKYVKGNRLPLATEIKQVGVGAFCLRLCEVMWLLLRSSKLS